MKHRFLLAEEPFESLLDTVRAVGVSTFTIDANEWEFQTDAEDFDDLTRFSAIFRGIFRTAGASGFSIHATICAGSDRSGAPVLPTHRGLRIIKIPFGAFIGPQAPNEAAMIVRLNSQCSGLNLAYSRI